MTQLAPALLDAAQQTLRTVDGVDLVLWPEDAAPATYGVEDSTTAAWMSERLTPHPWKTFTQPLHLGDPAALARIPRSIVNCTEPLSHRTPEWIARAQDGKNVWELDTGHDLMLSEPRATADLLLTLAR